MIKTISEIVRNIAILVLLTTFLDMLLPTNNAQRFIKVVMGLFIMVTILNPIVSLIHKDLEISSWQLYLPSTEKVDTVLAQGNMITHIQQSQIVEEYKLRIERQMEGMVNLIPEIASVTCQVSIEPTEKLGELARISKASFWITLDNGVDSSMVQPVEPIKIQINQTSKSTLKEANQEEVTQKIVDVIGNYFNIDKKSIKIYLN